MAKPQSIGGSVTRGHLTIVFGNLSCTVATYHTAQHIPDAVEKAAAVLAENVSYIEGKTTEEIHRALLHNTWALGRLTYPSGIAGLVIAAEPCLLEPIRKKWGIGYKLKVDESGDWKLIETETKKAVSSFNAIDEVVKILLRRSREKK